MLCDLLAVPATSREMPSYGCSGYAVHLTDVLVAVALVQSGFPVGYHLGGDWGVLVRLLGH